MRLTKLHIENFRGIEKFEISLLDQFTVLIGENGTGKTSILDAVAIGISAFAIEFSYLDAENIKIFQSFKKEDIRTTILNDNKKRDFPVRISISAFAGDKEIQWSRLLCNRDVKIPNVDKEHLIIIDQLLESYKTETGLKVIGSNEIVGIKSGVYDFINPNSSISELSEKYKNHQESTLLPLIAYYGTGRLWSNNQEVSYQQRGYRLDAYDNALNPNYSNRTFLSWYKTYEDEILKFKKDDSLLRAFKNAITTCVEEWSDIGFSFFDDDLKGLLTPENGEPYWMLFGMLSDGYRNLIGMVADMAYRCITLNPQLKENAVIETEGVVLIDEVGLHLHPKWQRKVVDDLKRTFPKVQFIATTHSPFIVQSLKASELVNLDRISDVNPSDLSVEEVALNLMGVPAKFSEANAQQEALSKDYLLKVNELQKSNGSAEDILKELDKMEHDISDPAVRAFLQMKKLQHTK